MRRAAVLLALAGVLEVGAAAAPPPAGCAERVAWIQDRLAHTAHRLRVWRWSWGLGSAGATALQLGLVPVVDDRDTRIDLLVGAAGTLAILVPVLLPPDVDERSAIAEGACSARLADAERRLQAAADSERSARSAWMHAGNVAFNVGVGLLLGLGFDHWTSGIVSAVVGIGVGEAEILTIPDESIDELGALRSVPTTRARLRPFAAPGVVGLGLVVHY